MKHYHVVGAIIEYKGKILCMQRPAGKFPSTDLKWEFPGGKIEPGETGPEALMRELREEMDFAVDVREEDFFAAVHHVYPEFELTMDTYLCHVADPRFTRKEHVDHCWLEPADMPALDWAAADYPIVMCVVRGEKPGHVLEDQKQGVFMNDFKRASEILYAGESVRGMDLRKPETLPIFETTAFTMDSLSELAEVTAEKGWTYSRTRNPNRAALAEAISYLEGGEASLIFASGMGAITVPMITLLQPGDRVLCNANIYGETFSTLREILSKMGVETDFVDYLDMDAVRAAIRPETKLVYSEVVSNPTVKIADIPALAELAHKNGALLMVDNTFTSPFAIRPMDFGADLVVNSLTKFLNGHADAMGGSMTTTAELVEKIRPVSMLVGTPGDAFSSWLILRGLRTAELRIPRQIKTAEKLAAFFAADPRISAVNHPSLAQGAQKELADKLFGENGSTPMMSFVLPEDIEKIDAFMKALRFTRYAPTLGGLRTTMSHPVTSSHFSMPDEERRKIGITPGMIRLSVGLEDPDDLIADFRNALAVFG